METQQHQIETTKTEDDDGKIAAAEVQHEKLRAQQVQHELEAEKWEVAFEKEPTSETFANRAIHQQLAKNAKLVTDIFELNHLRPLRDEKKRVERQAIADSVELEILETQVEFEKLGGSILELGHALDHALARYAELFHTIQSARNAGATIGQPSLKQLVDMINAKISTLVGGPMDSARANFAFVDDLGNNQNCTLTLMRPTKIQHAIW